MKNNNSSQIEQLNIQVAFTSALVFAISLNIYTTLGYKDILINGNKSNFTTKNIYNLGLLSASITLIVTIYFLIISYEAYESDKNNASFNYYMASVLSFTAQSIRISTLLKYPESVTGIEDVI